MFQNQLRHEAEQSLEAGSVTWLVNLKKGKEERPKALPGGDTK